MTDATSLLSPGLTVAGTYEIERQLGRGGMGEVWLAKHLRLAGKLVAIKVLKLGGGATGEALARFKREAEIAAKLEHPNIVQVLDFNSLPTGEPYLVMEYLKGQSLAARAAGRPLPLEQLFSVIRQVGDALQAAHQAGVVYRDLKPENIFLVPTALGDQVKVLDFGISKLAYSKTVETTESTLLGTPLYMSPEQALGQNKDVTAQSDVFSLGSICFELLTGTAPFTAENIAKVVFRIAYEAAPDLRVQRPDLPENVCKAVDHALMKDRTLRTLDIAAFVAELTGQPLGEVRAIEASGVVAPGMLVTPSIDSGATKIPSAVQARTADQPQPPSGPPPASEVSGRKLMLSILVITFVVAAAITRVRMGNWAERDVYRSGMRDAGYVMLADGTFVFPDGGEIRKADAGVVEIDAGVVEVDAGVAEEVDAGVVLDSGVAAAPVKKKDMPMTPAEEKQLEEVAAMSKQQKWADLWDRRASLRLNLQTPKARARGLTALTEAVCHRTDNAGLNSLINELKDALSPAQLRDVKKQCVALYPGAEFLSW